MKSQMRHTVGEIQKGPVQELLSPWSWDAPPSQHAAPWMCSPTWQLSERHTLGLL